MEKRLEQLREEYKSVPIPKELDSIVEKALQQKPKKKRIVMWPTSTAVAAAVLFTAVVNINPDAAQAMSKIPVIGKVVQAITFVEMKEEKNQSSIDVKTPALSGLSDHKLEDSINRHYMKESKELYQEFMKATSKSKKGHLSIYSDYETVTDTADLISIRRDIEKTQASSYTQSRYITIDKKNEAVLTLKSLFKDDRYIKVISENIKEQMKKQMKEDPNKIYWVEEDDMTEPFKAIRADQNFYITDKHKLVISFDEYEAAPGYMGVTEFTIPTSVISKLLVGDRYIR
ncbi:anti-sigma-V factor RsiV [Bacillus sp. JK74]